MIATLLALILRPDKLWDAAYKSGYDQGCWYASSKVGDPAERSAVFARWGIKRRESMLPSSAGREALMAEAVALMLRPQQAWDIGYDVGYDEGYGDTIVGIAGKSRKWKENFDRGVRESDREWTAWHERLLQAERNDAPFTEPPPSRHRTTGESHH